MNNANRLSGLIAISAFVFVCGCAEKPKTSERIYPVSIGEVAQKDIPLFAQQIGNVHSLQVIQVRPQVSGIIQEAFVKQGQYVKKGDRLYQIDPRPYQASLDQAKAKLIIDIAALKLAEVTLSRNAKLIEQDYVSKLNHDQFIANIESAKGQIGIDKANIALALLNLEWTAPVSPINGKISQYFIYPGNLVVANDPNAFTDIRQIDPADIWFVVNQNDFVHVQKAMKNQTLKFEVSLPQDPTMMREGQIYFVDNHLDLATAGLLLKGTVSNEDEFFWPGEFVNVRLIFNTMPNALLVPDEAVQIGQEGPFVYIYRPETSTVEYRKVVKGESIDKMVRIIEGVSVGEKVILKGQINLKPGAKVEVAGENTHP